MTSRSVLGRPRRTKVYDCNFNAGERYYRPVVDSLDRKGTGRASSTPEPDSAISRMRATLLADSDSDSSSFRRRQPKIEDDFEIEEPRRKVKSALLDEYDSIFDSRNKSKRGDRVERSPNTVIRSLEDEADKEITAYLKRIQDRRPARPTMEDEFESSVTPRNSKRRQQIDFQEKLLDTVGLKNSESNSLENDVFFKKRTLRVTAEDDEEAPSITKWTALKALDNDSDDLGSASARARRTRNRLQDLNSEIEELTNKSAAREKRLAQLKEFVRENEANAAENSLSSSSRVVQKSSVRSEKKTVTF